MAELQEIEVVVTSDGMVKVHVQGVAGAKCLAVTEELERLLGNEITERILTDEYVEQEQHEQESLEIGLKKP
jgi:hypothetical protein|uniref:DUF2997 domain-containing protein n=1 Tax=Desulfomonile tiedjei TaxID=2358 RepID=A0A7C4ER56_9BACT